MKKREKLSELIKREFNMDIEVSSVVMDSRKIEEKSLFFAINKGNDFVEEAIKKGASLVIADGDVFKNAFQNKSDCSHTDLDKNYIFLLDEKILIVNNTIETMQDLATKYRELLGIKVIGITGSNGKTTTKDVLYSILSQKYSVMKTEGNYNNHIGLPFTLLNATDDVEIAVLEMGMSSFGEIKRLGEISKPNFGIITNIGDSHLAFLKNRENVFKAKTELLEFLEDENSVVCGDDFYLKDLSSIKVGFDSFNNFKIVNYSFTEKESKFLLENEEYSTNLIGKHNILNIAMAIILAKKLNLSIEEIKNGMKNIQVSSMRFQEIKIGEDVYINDAYNASPTSMSAAIDTFDSIYQEKYKYKIAILGDMLELGENEINFHLEILNKLLDKKIKLVYLYGERMKKAYDIFMKSKKEEYRFWHYSNKKDIADSLSQIRMEKVVLLKGSRGMKLEEIIEMKEGKKV